MNIDLYFPMYDMDGDPVNLKALHLNEEARYSMTFPKYAEDISNFIRDIMGTNNITITDATSCLGGNTINFAKHFKSVNAVEWKSTNAYFLNRNLSTFKIKNVRVYESDYTKIMTELKQDVVFIDPPWGGYNYKKYRFLNLYMNGINIITIVNNLIEHTKCVVLKVPFNFNFIDFYKKIKFSERIDTHIFPKYYILCLYKK